MLKFVFSSFFSNSFFMISVSFGVYLWFTEVEKKNFLAAMGLWYWCLLNCTITPYYVLVRCKIRYFRLCKEHIHNNPLFTQNATSSLHIGIYWILCKIHVFIAKTDHMPPLLTENQNIREVDFFIYSIPYMKLYKKNCYMYIMKKKEFRI